MRALRGLAALLLAGVSAASLAAPALAAPREDPSPSLSPASVGADGLLSVAVAVPLTVPPSSEGLLTAAELEDFTSESGLLTVQLDELFGRPVAIGIDPRVIASIRVLGADAPESATAWLSRLASAPNETFALGYADADPVAGIQAGSPAPLTPLGFGFAIDPARFAVATGDGGPDAPSPDPDETPTTDATADPDALPPLPLTTDDVVAWDYDLTGIAWPGDSTVVSADLPALQSNGVTDVVLGSANAGGTAAVRLAFDSAPGLTATVSDDVLSGLLRDGVRADSDVEVASAVGRLTAGLASAAAAPDGPVRLVTLDRRWPLGGYHLDEMLDAIAASATAQVIPFSRVLEIDPVTSTISDSPEDATRVTAIAAAFAAATTETSFATVAVDPTAITGPRRLDLLALLSIGWQDDGFWPSAAQGFLDESTEMIGSVQITKSTDILALGSSAPLPVTVRNDLDVPISVDISARALQPVLSIRPGDLPVTVTVQPNSSAIGSIPAEALTNGKVAVALSLSSGSGVPIGASSSVVVDVQAGWETAGTLVAVILVVGVFGFGLVRNILKRRRERDGDEGDGEPTGTDPEGVPTDGAAEPDAASTTSGRGA